MNDFVKPKDQRELAHFGLARNRTFNKTDIRGQIKAMKRHFPAEEAAQCSASLASRLLVHPRLVAAYTILLYHPLPDEPDLRRLIAEWHASKQVLLPVVAGNSLKLRRYEAEEALEQGAFRIMEPQGPDFTAWEQIEVAIIPGVAFDDACRRLGRGRGYYDRLLSAPSCRGMYKIGVAFQFQHLAALPSEAHDVPMDEVVFA